MSVSVKVIMNIDDYMAIDNVINRQIESLKTELAEKPYLYNQLKEVQHLANLWRSV